MLRQAEGVVVRIVEPLLQVTIGEEIKAQECDQIRERPLCEGREHLHILQQEDGDQRRPELDLHRIRAGSHKGLDLQMLFLSACLQQAGLDFMHRPLGDVRKAGEVAVVIQHQMKFDGSFGGSKLRPVKDAQAEVNDGGINAVQLILEPKFSFALPRGLRGL